MAFENVDVGSLKSAINSCKDVIRYNQSLQLIGKISNNNVWNTESRTHLKGSLTKLTSKHFNDLKTKLNTASNVATLIEEYKNLEQENKDYKRQINNLDPEYSQDEINRLYNKINKNKRKMEQIVARVDSLIGGM